MNCPRCENADLDEKERDGVVIDVCRSCRGVWLDRGELEKLMARAMSEVEEIERSTRPQPGASDARVRERQRDDDSDRHRVHGQRGHRKKKKWYESLGDIFD